MKPILAININDMIDVQAISESIQDIQDPVIFNMSKAAIRFAGLDYLAALFEVAKRRNSNILLQLDHATDMNYIRECVMNVPFDIVMADGSKRDLHGNIAFTREVVELGKQYGFQVEGEIGVVPDGLDGWQDSYYTNVDEAVQFVQQTGVDYLAVSVGNVHGFGANQPLHQALIRELAQATGTPLVLHGADFLTAEDMGQALQNGICKINIGPDIRVPYHDVIASFAGNESIDHRTALLAAKDAMKSVLADRLNTVYKGAFQTV